MWAKRNQHGFTIVELLIVIVVIGILAAIVTVTYNGIQSRAQTAAATSALTQANKKLAIYLLDNGGFPINLATAGLTDSGGTSYQYSVDNTVNPPTYCVTATNGTTSYKSNSTTPTPSSGGCAGHGVGGSAAVTNLMTNPSFETNTSGWGANITTLARLAPGGVRGSAYLSATRTAAGDAYIYQSLTPNAPLSTSYTISFWIWADAPTTLVSGLILRHSSGAGYHELATVNTPAVTTTPTRIVMSGTTNSSSSTSGLQFIGRLPAAIGTAVYYDGFMLTQGSTVYNYGDGNSTDWVWNSSINNSTSTGPSL